ncbi:C-X-C motif chemokine 6-like [Xiphias gladius]|uniref:C-X-C motif chemokine 6-like n=1 Tax=Xiphias gladius TaxID=8245 RepID=UPI001A98329D|nr:C-X-C motif chemokine 6-like [Xiphias gladius]
MSSVIKVFLLLAVMVCISRAQLNESRQICLCQSVRHGIGNATIKDIHIHPATIFCDKVEIVVTANSGRRFCLNPKLNGVKKLLANIIKNRKTTTTLK